MNQIEKIKEIADSMIGIGGNPSNEEFYAEFDMRVRVALNIYKSDVCEFILAGICNLPDESDCADCVMRII